MPQSKLIRLMWEVLLLLGLISCAPVHENLGAPGSSKNQVPIEEVLSKPKQIVYSHVRDYVLTNYCIECHQPSDRKANVDLTSYEKITSGGALHRQVTRAFNPEASLIYETLHLPTSAKRHMPPIDRKQLTKLQKDLMYNWIKNGAKQEAGQVVEVPKSLAQEFQPFFSNPETIDFADIQKHVFANSCTKCHSANGVTPDQDAMNYSANLTSYETIFPPEDELFIPKSIKKGKPKSSSLYKAIAMEQSMPPPKDGYQPMNSLRIKLLRLWILNCAIEDFESLQNDNIDLDAKSKGKDKIRKCEGQ